MARDLTIRCRCGAFAGTLRQVSGNAGNRGVCYCDDCQAFARYLGAESTVLDAQGGTDIFQMSPASLAVAQGLDRLACVRVTAKGPFRWYADCCKAPVGNTAPTRQLPIVGVILSSVQAAPRELDAALGPVRARIMARYARGTVAGPEPVYEGFPPSHIARMLWKILVWRIRGDHRRSPFFDPGTGAPIAPPHLLRDSEHA
ncbi:MAG: DUF6151 family protein [Arenicellales bacterium]